MASNICLKTFRTACAAVAVAATAIACGQGLPDGYAPLDWIESTGGQYIDTGVDAGAHTTIDMSFGRCVYENGSTLFGKEYEGDRPFGTVQIA